MVPFLDKTPHGVFATRAPRRPNAIGLSILRLVAVDGTTLHVEDVDILDGTPVLDIKPYLPCNERGRDAKVPAWAARWPQWYEENEGFDWAAEFTFED